MSDTPRAAALLAQVARGLVRHGREETARTLGDRRTYIGLSDVGRAITCMRAAVLNKIDGKPAETLQRQLILQRGHWLEAGLIPAFRANGAKLMSQLEISITPGDVPIRAHLDLAMVADCVVRVLELKSTARLPDVLSPGYEIQLYGQIGLLHAYWNQPVFGAEGLSQRTFPQLVQTLFGIVLPDAPERVDLEGWVLSVSMNDAKAFGPYEPNAAMTDLVLRTAEALWHAMRQGDSNLPTCPGFHPLCDWCDHATGCPKFQTNPVSDPILEAELETFSRLKAEKARIEEEILDYETRIRRFHQRAGNPAGWLSTGRFRFRSARIPGRRSIDQTKLRVELTNRLGPDDADALLERITTTGNDYDRLTVSPLK